MPQPVGGDPAAGPVEERDDFDGPALAPYWLSIRERPPHAYSLDTRSGWLTLHATGGSLDDPLPTFVDRLPALRDAAKREGREPPALAPRIALHPTERPVEGTDRAPGHGTLAQIHEDVAELATLGVSHLLLDPFLAVFLDAAPAEPFPTNDPYLLQVAAEKLVDLPSGTVR